MKTVRSIALIAAAATTAGCWWAGASCDTELHSVGEMPDLDMHVGDTVETDLRDYFRPVECIQDGFPPWFVDWSDSAAVAVSAPVGSETLTTAALAAADSVRVTVYDGLLYPNPHEFLVRVRPPVDGS